jgi:hypothetical protein
LRRQKMPPFEQTSPDSNLSGSKTVIRDGETRLE